MKYAIVFTTRTGNTRELAESVKDALEGKDLIYFGSPADKALEADLIYVGFWTNMGQANEEMMEFISKLENKDVFLFGSAGFGTDPAYFDKIITRTSEKLGKSNTVTGTFMCQGRMPSTVRARYEKMLLSPETKEKAEMLIGNFDAALSHPDETDRKRLENTVRALL